MRGVQLLDERYSGGRQWLSWDTVTCKGAKGLVSWGERRAVVTVLVISADRRDLPGRPEEKCLNNLL